MGNGHLRIVHIIAIKVRQIIQSYKYGFSLASVVVLLHLLSMSSCVPTSRHFEEAMDNPVKQQQMNKDEKTDEEIKYWERVRKNRESLPKIYIEDSIDEERKKHQIK